MWDTSESMKLQLKQMGFAFLWTSYGREGWKRKMLKLIYGLRRSHHQMDFEDGFPILLKNMMSLKRDTDRNCLRTQHHRSLKICVCRSCKITTWPFCMVQKARNVIMLLFWRSGWKNICTSKCIKRCKMALRPLSRVKEVVDMLLYTGSGLTPLRPMPI